MTRRAITALLLAGCLGAGLIACGSDDDEAASGTSTTISGPQRGVKDVDISEPRNTDEKPSVAVPDGRPPRGLQQADIVEGTGPALEEGDTITAHYVGLAWSTGQEFDASWDRGEPIDVTIGEGSVIPGWERGLVGMKEGGRRVLVIPPDQAYGEEGQPPTIGPNETLVFVIDAVEVTPAE